MPYLAEAVANSFLDIAKSSGETVDAMKIQKLVYFSHGWHLGFDKGALSAENAQAWRWGPVFPDLYQVVKVWGSRPIMGPLETMDVGEHRRLQWNTPRVPPEDTFAMELIERAWEVYGHMPGLSLSQLTHEPGGPWDTIRKKNPYGYNLVIPNNIIKKHFAQKISANAGT